MSKVRLINKAAPDAAPPAGKLQLEAVNNAFVVQGPHGDIASFSGVNTGDQDSETLSVRSALDADYSTLQGVIDTQLSTGIVGDAELISDAGDGMVRVAESNVLLRIGDGDTEEMRFFKVPESLGLVLDDGALNYVYARFDVGGVLYEATTTERSDTNTNILIGTVYRSGTTVHINNNFRVRANDNLRRVALRFVETMPFARSSGGIVSEVGTRNLHITAGRWWECTNPFTTDTFDSSDADTFTAAYSDGADGWAEQAAQTQIDNTYYDDLSGTLAEALPNRYLTRWVYLETDGHVVVVYGRAQHVTEALAEAEAEPPRPPRIQAAGRLLARIIVQVGASAFTSIQNVDTGIEFTSPTTHNGLGGLQGGEAGFYGHLTEAQQTSAPVEFGDSAGLDVGVANGVAGLDANGLVPITQIPPAAIERLTVVADESARFALTTATVQEGDTVKQADTGLMYLVVDEDNLGNASGYVEYTAGQAASVAYSGITGKPVAIDALDDLTPDADKLPYYTGGSSAALADLTAAGRALLGDADADDQLDTLGGSAVGKALFKAASKSDARNTLGVSMRNFFDKVNPSAVAFTKTGAGTASIKAGTQIAVGDELVTFAADTPIAMPTLTAGTDYAIWVKDDGSIAASISHASAPDAGNWRKIGGFHYGLVAPGTTVASGGFSTASPSMIWTQEDVDKIAGINEFSLWDLLWRCKGEQRGMALDPQTLCWMGIYFLSTDHITNGPSRYNTDVASGTVLPKIPLAYGGDGVATYGRLSQYEAEEILSSHGLRLCDPHEFRSAMFGVTEAQSLGGPSVTISATAREPGYTSRIGCEQATGHEWVHARGNSAAGGSEWISGPDRGGAYGNPYVFLMGGSRDYAASSGSRCSLSGNVAWHSYWYIAVRAAGDHLMPVQLAR